MLTVLFLVWTVQCTMFMDVQTVEQTELIRRLSGAYSESRKRGWLSTRSGRTFGVKCISDEQISGNWFKQISQYIWMPLNWLNKYPTIVRCPRVDGMNIRIYSDSEELTEPISQYMQMEEKPHKWKQIIYASYFIRQCRKFIIKKIRRKKYLPLSGFEQTGRGLI